MSVNTLVLFDRPQQVMTENAGVLLKREGKRPLGKTCLSCSPFLSHQVSGACVGNTNPHVKHLPSSYSNSETFSRCCDGAEGRLRKGDGTISESCPPYTHTSARWHHVHDEYSHSLLLLSPTVTPRKWFWLASGVLEKIV